MILLIPGSLAKISAFLTILEGEFYNTVLN